MSLKYIFAAIALLSLTLVLFGYFQSEDSMYAAISRTNKEKQSIYQKSVQVALDVVAEQQKFFARDYSHWDDMAEAVQNNDIEWIDKEFYGPLEIYQSDAVWVLDSSKQTIYFQQATSSAKISALNLPDFDWAKINQNQYERETQTFFELDANQRLIAYFITPIFYHSIAEQSQESYGYIIIADRWDDNVLAKLAAILQAKVKLQVYQQNKSLTDGSPQKLITTLKNTKSQPIADLHFEFRDHSIELLANHFSEVLVRSTVLGLLGIAFSLAIFHFWVSLPITKMIEKLHRENKNSVVKAGSELQVLAQEIDHSLEQAHKILETNEALKAADRKLENAFIDLQKAENITKAQLRNSLKLSKALDSASESVVITDLDGSIEYVNPAWKKLNGYTSEEVIGKRPSVLKSGRTNSSLYKKMWDAIKLGDSFSSEELINRRKDGSLYAAQVSIYPVESNGQQVNFVGIARDISEKKEQDHVRSEFISLASHQLRTPLTSLRWLSELLYKQVKSVLPKEQVRTIKDIQTNSIRMIYLVNRLLNLSRIETGRLSISPKKTVLKSFLNTIKDEMAPIAKRKKIKLSFSLPKQLTPINVDGDLLFEIIINLISNSLKYTKQTGEVVVEVIDKKSEVLFVISDTGIGIPTNEQHRIFERFFRASNAQAYDENGTGLGLYLVKLLVCCLGGAIVLQSKENSGTRVEFTIPRHASQKKGEVKILKSSLSTQVKN